MENRKYMLGTEENKQFLKEMREGLLRFGHQFPSPGGSSYYLGDDGRTEIVKPGSPHVWLMYTALEACWDMKEVKLLQMRL